MAEYHHTPEPRPAKAKYPATRQLKVLETTSGTQVRPRDIGINYVPVNLEPCIVLRGKWLREAGFIIGEKVTVIVNKGSLLIKPNQAPSGPTGKQ
ncbi:SymE family type I addiction module toxin [Thalassomonas haliotis]|uniref:Type I addiction module toxin, SymE family n=1 Tax=Thalassomonas haliotis TaxID=485448 RepID=A0ABY7VBL0_9GAMM|nr:SymE family type I addiction module toxin [Thalassomonas haliotis]WDE11027.1 type I addiction module toxin, SymE family [Thalassomonas haliotis]